MNQDRARRQPVDESLILILNLPHKALGSSRRAPGQSRKAMVDRTRRAMAQGDGSQLIVDRIPRNMVRDQARRTPVVSSKSMVELARKATVDTSQPMAYRARRIMGDRSRPMARIMVDTSQPIAHRARRVMGERSQAMAHRARRVMRNHSRPMAMVMVDSSQPMAHRAPGVMVDRSKDIERLGQKLESSKGIEWFG